MFLDEFIQKVRRKEGRFPTFLHHIYRKIIAADLKVPKCFGRLFLTERFIRRGALRWLGNKLYYEPMFRCKIYRGGRNIRLDGDLPLIIGNGRILIGSNVSIGNRQTWTVTPNLYKKPILVIGDNTSVNYQTEISCECLVKIGAFCRIAGGVKIFDNNSHSVFLARNREMTYSDVKPVIIRDNVWVGMRAIILKGVTIGNGSVVAAGAVVTKNVPAMSVVAGNPAKVVKVLESS